MNSINDEIYNNFLEASIGMKALFSIIDDSNFEENFSIFKSFVISSKEKYYFSYFIAIIDKYKKVRSIQYKWMLPRLNEFYEQITCNIIFSNGNAVDCGVKSSKKS